MPSSTGQSLDDILTITSLFTPLVTKSLPNSFTITWSFKFALPIKHVELIILATDWRSAEMICCVWKFACAAICSFFFLAILLLFAIIHNAFLRLPLRVEVTQEAFPTSDLKMVPDLRYYLNLLGLDALEYSVITPDGFIITLTRVTDLSSEEQTPTSRKPVLLVHGLLQHSGAYVTSGTKSLAYFLHHQGYDVWLGNNRCGFDPQHQFYTPGDPNMWAWDIHEMAMYDLSSLIKEVLCHSVHPKLSLVCHSQSTTQAFIALSRVSQSFPTTCLIHDRVNCFVALAPAVYGGPILTEKAFIRFINTFPTPVFHLFFGVTSFIPFMLTCRRWFVRMPSYGWFAYQMFRFLFGWNDSLWDPAVRNQQFVFAPVYVSAKLIRWWLCNKAGDSTRSVGFMSNNGAVFKHEERWFDEAPPIMLVVGGKDRLVDGSKLLDHFSTFDAGSVVSAVTVPEYAHLDVLWADDVLQRVGVPMADFLAEWG
ncbi:hypothetical protein BABINDRAFT_170863 [Babjeviella inositovora NRRL Y-12698]|uniref:Partial AB-hydrolase lipase domain-containing protein n=1 Tax=Babjeviella inositovora NRRL Y-12698 TaxID=984486 RepID=A0A1E3QUD8_9ASCO|nr:uncharacterized protein BABINDRAFT_170863 [Babjeviella inositovora NRRL Y-12698]ODQ81301.1 hypothetical protein BABINDRAFT_170863 [Babjeviella inositovora NRRL Y-12698]